MEKANQFIVSGIILLTFTAVFFLKYFYAYVIFGREEYNLLSPHARTLIVQGSGMVICAIATLYLCGLRISALPEALGLSRRFSGAFVFGILCTVPMAVGFGYLTGFNMNSSFGDLFWGSAWPGFHEEFVFRGFLAGLLIRKARWHLVPAILVSGSLFALGHLYQADSLISGLQVFLFTMLASAGFTLLYLCWNWNLWITIFLHFFMNFWWVFYTIEENVAGNARLNIFRFAAIAIAVIWTVIRMKKNGQTLRSIRSDKM